MKFNKYFPLRMASLAHARKLPQPPLAHMAMLMLVALGIFATLPDPAFAKITLEAPQKVAKGDAFLARALSDQPARTMTFFWKGKTYPVECQKMTDDTGVEQYVAEILLPVPLNEQTRKQQLGVGPGNITRKNAIDSVHADISLFEKQRPVQKLTVDKKYVDPPDREKARIQRDREKVRQALADKIDGHSWTLPFTRPVPGTVSSQFGMKRVFNGQPRSVHKGLDLRGASGTPIKACADGRVALVDNLYFSGNTVYINHGDGVFSAYLHMSEPKVQPGQMVKKGDVVGLVGATGRVTGPHLHLSVLVQGQPVDPQPLLETAR